MFCDRNSGGLSAASSQAIVQGHRFRYSRFLTTACAMLAMAIAGLASGQDRGPAGTVVFSETEGVTLEEFVRRALSFNGEVVAARLEVDRARAQLRQARLLPNPRLDAERLVGPSFFTPEDRETSVTLGFPVTPIVRRRSRVRVAEVEVLTAESQAAERERGVVREVVGAYGEALTAYREAQALDRMRETDEQTRDIAVKRVESQDVAPLDVRRVEVELARLAAKRRSAKGRLEAAALRLRALARVQDSEKIRIRSLEAWFPLPASHDEAVATALAARPDVRLARLQEQLAEAELELTRREAFPELELFGRYSSKQSSLEVPGLGTVEDRERTFGGGASISLPLFNRNQGAIAAASVTAHQAVERRRQIERTAAAEVAAALARYLAADSALSEYEGGVLKKSEEIVATIQEAYRLGALPFTDLIAEQRRLLESQRDLSDLIGERFRALADLEAALGSPTTEKVR
jgi:outer membrane protein, heavy metal efflux system